MRGRVEEKEGGRERGPARPSSKEQERKEAVAAATDGEKALDESDGPEVVLHPSTAGGVWAVLGRRSGTHPAEMAREGVLLSRERGAADVGSEDSGESNSARSLEEEKSSQEAETVYEQDADERMELNEE